MTVAKRANRFLLPGLLVLAVFVDGVNCHHEANLVSDKRPRPIGCGFKSKPKPKPSQSSPVGNQNQSTPAKPAPATSSTTQAGSIPTLTGNTLPELARSAFETVARSGGTQAEKAALFERLIPQIQKAGGFTATRSVGTEGSVIFAGEFGEALVISPAGRVFRGSLQRSFQLGQGGTLTPLFDKLRLVQ